MKRLLAAGSVVLVLSACTDATDIDLLEVSATSALAGQAFLDLDGSGSPTPADDPIRNADVTLVTAGTGAVAKTTTTDSLGIFVFFDVPVGNYRLRLPPSVLGDSLEILGSDDPIAVELGDTSAVGLGATFFVLDLEEALLATPGQRIFTSGIALNSRVNFGDGQVHFAGDSAFLRALNVERSPLVPGDSVRLLGRVVVDNGRAALDAVTPFILVQQAALVTPRGVTTGEAASADGGPLDAALVRIRDAEITDTSTTVAGDFRFWADDGSDSVEVVLRAFLGLDGEVFGPETVRIDRMDGLLSPIADGTGAVRWRLLPRGASDIVLEPKPAGVGIAASVDNAEAIDAGSSR